MARIIIASAPPGIRSGAPDDQRLCPYQMSASGIFRKAALERLSSPEQLDQALTVATPRGWAATAFVALALAGVVVWSVVGQIPNRTAGQGLLIAEGGRLLDAVAQGDGVLSDVLVDIGGAVTAGQAVARIANPDLALQLQNQQAVVAEREAALSGLEADLARETALRQAAMAARTEALRTRLAAARARLTYQEQRLADLEALPPQSVASRDALARARDDVAAARQDLAEIETGAADLRARELEATLDSERRHNALQGQIAEARRRVGELQARSSRGGVVLAPETGRVIELKQLAGARVTAGQPILALQTGGDSLEVVLFVAPRDGKSVKPGMPAQINPSSAPREAFGSLKGEVVSISDFPVSMEGIRAVVDNPSLAQSFVTAGPPFLARIRLDRDPDALSGYRWTSSKGADLVLSGGTLATVEVETSTSRPIDMVVPLLKEWTGL